MTASEALDTWALDREIALARVVAAPREIVFQAWSEPHHLPRWFGPEGFTVETAEIAVAPGGRWRFAYIAPDATRYDNRIVFRAVDGPRLLVMDHGPDQDEDESVFRVTVTFDEQDDGKTVVTLRQLHPTKEQRDATVRFGAVEMGLQTLAKLARYVEARQS